MKKIKVISLLLCIIFIASIPTIAETILTWETNSDADYYVVYWSLTEGGEVVGHSDNIPEDTLTYTIPKEHEGMWFSVKAFNNCGNSSDFSEWIEGKGGGTIILQFLENCKMSIPRGIYN